jgi:hypothetical protein
MDFQSSVMEAIRVSTDCFNKRQMAYWLFGIAVLLPIACAGCGINVNRPSGNAIGSRHRDFMRVVAYAKTLPVGMYERSTFPPEARIKNLLAIYVDRRKAYALEFPSEPIDSNPIYVYVEEDVPDPESVVRSMCDDKGGWRFARKLDERGWYYVYGP